MPDFDRSWGAVLYTEPMRHLLHAFKYQKKTVLRHLFADLMISFIEQHQIPIKNFDCLIPIPIHPVKRREREFNQTELLCRLLEKKFDVPVCTKILTRPKNTAPQAFLEEKERWTNVQGTFRIRNPLEFKNKSVLLIDDLMTTGATACEAAKACKQAGAAKVSVLTLAIGL
jgi:ComF family protein